MSKENTLVGIYSIRGKKGSRGEVIRVTRAQATDRRPLMRLFRPLDWKIFDARGAVLLYLYCVRLYTCCA